MRLTASEIDAIKVSASDVFPNCVVYLFGSRVDDSKRGGDIDLYIKLSDKTHLFEKKIKFLAQLKRAIGEQKIDLVFNLDPNRLIEVEANKWKIEL